MEEWKKWFQHWTVNYKEINGINHLPITLFTPVSVTQYVRFIDTITQTYTETFEVEFGFVI